MLSPVVLFLMFDAEHRGAPRLTRVPQVRPLIFSLNSLRIRTSANPRSQALYNLYLQIPPTTNADKEVTSLLESTLTKNAPLTPLESTLTKKGVGGPGEQQYPINNT